MPPFPLGDPHNDLILEPGQDLVLKDTNGTEVLRLDADEGRIRIRSANGTIGLLDGNTGNLKLGGAGVDGDLLLYRGADNQDSSTAAIRLNGQQAELSLGTDAQPGAIEASGPRHRIVLEADNGQVTIAAARSGRPRVQLLSSGAAILGGPGTKGRVELRNGNGTVIRFDAANGSATVGGGGEDGQIRVLNADDQTTLLLNGATGNLAVGGDTEHGAIFVKSGAGQDQNVFMLNGERGDVVLGCPDRGSDLSLRDDDGAETILIRGKTGNIAAGREGKPGNIFVKNANRNNSIHLSGETGNANIEGNLNVAGDVRLAGGDCAEEFTMATKAPPGSVVAVRDDGSIVPTQDAYDSRVVGIVSGAGDFRPAITLDAAPTAEPRAPIALGGKVCCLADASRGPINIGDLLVSSNTRGHAMAAGDPLRAFGCVVGKALEPLAEGCGLIRVFAFLN